MSRDDIQKLMGGYATGTLTPEERQALFEAALTDQELFDALAREEALREVLSDPAARAHLLAAMDDVPAPWYRQWWRPMTVMAAAVLVVAGVAVWQSSRAPKPLPMAKVELPRWRPHFETPSAPILPPAPQVKQPAPTMAPLSLPGAAPAAPPPPPPAPAAAPLPVAPPATPSQAPAARAAISGSGSFDGPRMQQAQQSQMGTQSQQGAGQSQARLQAPSNTPSDIAAGSLNSFVERDSALLHGAVTDASGAGIRSATVVVKSLSTGEIENTATDDRGEFKAPGVPGGAYRISASAPGFQSATVSRVTPVSGTPEPVNLQLAVSATAETVEVTAAATPVQTAQTVPMAADAVAVRAGTGGAPGFAPALKKAKAATLSELDCHLLRRIPGGDPVEVPAGETVPPGASLILRIVPAADGYLSIVESTRTISSPKVKRGVAVETALPQFDNPGRVELQVYFSRQAGEPKQKESKQAPAATIGINIQ